MVDFSKPLEIVGKGGYRRPGQTIRVIASDRICPVGFNHVLLVRNPDAMFGDEEFVVTAKEDGTVSGRGFEGKLINPVPPKTEEDPVQHPDNEVGERLKKAFYDIFGFYPVLCITDNHEMRGHDGRLYDSARHYLLLDTQKLNLIGDHELYYVDDHLEEVLKEQRVNKGDGVELEGSRKYSFGDTMDWWKPAMITHTDGDVLPLVSEGRTIIHVYIVSG